MTNLAMPAKYIEIDREEMTYIGGGYWYDYTVSSTAVVINVAIALTSLGMSIDAKIATVVARMGWTWVKSKAKSAIIGLGISSTVATKVCGVLTSATSFSIGYACAYFLDIYDKSGKNGRVQF